MDLLDYENGYTFGRDSAGLTDSTNNDIWILTEGLYVFWL